MYVWYLRRSYYNPQSSKLMQMFQTKDSNLLSLMQSQLSSAPLHLLHTDSWLDPQKYTWFRIYGLRFCPPKLTIGRPILLYRNLFGTTQKLPIYPKKPYIRDPSKWNAVYHICYLMVAKNPWNAVALQPSSIFSSLDEPWQQNLSFTENCHHGNPALWHFLSL